MAQKSRPNSAPRKGGAAARAASGKPSQQPRPARQAATAEGSAISRPQRPGPGPATPKSDRMQPGASRTRPVASATVSPLQRQTQRQHKRARQAPLNRSRWAAAGILLALAIVIVAVVITRSVQSRPSVKLNETQQPPSASGIHVAEGSTIHYDYNPPSSGPHYPSPANWGVYPQALAPGTWVHNLEHGGIVVLYQCPGTCPDLQAQLQTLYSQLPLEQQFHERKVVITPFANLDHLLRIQAWGWTLPLDSVDTAAVDAFYTEHVDKGPEQIP